MKNIYFVQACDLHGAAGNESAYLPYATGLLAAYAFHSDIVKEHYTVKRFIYKKEDISSVIRSMENPAVVGFSTYIWNYEYNKALAAALKQKYPSCLTVFGGHSVKNDSAAMLEEHEFIDFLIHGEGEIAFRSILEHFCTDQRFSEIPNISYRDSAGTVVMNWQEPICSINYPSPYLEGWFDDLLEQEDVSFSALLETNRGCPFKCAYCDWGSMKLRMRQFPLERVVSEMQYFAEKKIEFCFCIDSNFGMFPRDFQIVDAFLKIKEQTGYPEAFKCCTTEGSGLAEFKINKKLNDCGILKGASLALQTLSEEALKNIGRKNMSIQRYGELAAKYNENGIPTYSELIYGLPGETFESFSSNLCYMLESGTTKGCFIHYCELLPNAALAKKENIEKFQIRSAKIPYTQFHSAPKEIVQEYSNIIVSTYSMPYGDWVRACIFGLFVQAFHYMGILQFFSKFLFYEKSISYKDFFCRLIAWAENAPETLLGKYYLEMKQKLGALDQGKMITRVHINPQFGNIDWPLEEGLVLEIIANIDRFFAEIFSFADSFGLEHPVLRELLDYQYHMLRKPADTTARRHYSYDFKTFFYQIDIGAATPLQKVENDLIFQNNAKTVSLEDYATRIVWYGRKSAKIIYDFHEVEQRFSSNASLPKTNPDADCRRYI